MRNSNSNIIMNNHAIRNLIAVIFLYTILASGTLTYAQSSLTAGNYVPSWIKIKFYQSYGYSWDQASLEQRARFVKYCERMKEQWKKEDRQYEKKTKAEDKRLEAYRRKKSKFRKYLRSRRQARIKKAKAKEKAQRKKRKALMKAQKNLKKMLRRIDKSH